MAPVRVDRVGPSETAPLRHADQPGDRVMPVGEDEVAWNEAGCFLPGSITLDRDRVSRHHVRVNLLCVSGLYAPACVAGSLFAAACCRLRLSAFRMPTALTSAPNRRSPAPTSIARWKDEVEASRTTPTRLGSGGVLSGLTVLRKLLDETSTPGRREASVA